MQHHQVNKTMIRLTIQINKTKVKYICEENIKAFINFYLLKAAKQNMTDNFKHENTNKYFNINTGNYQKLLHKRAFIYLVILFFSC